MQKMKLVPQSECNCLVGPRSAKKRLGALMKLEELISSTTSIWTALVHKQVTNTAYLLPLAWPPFMLLVDTSHGLNISITTKAGSTWSRSAGRSHICCSLTFPQNFLPAPHWLSILLMTLLPPTNHRPLALMASSVKCLPWCRTLLW